MGAKLDTPAGTSHTRHLEHHADHGLTPWLGIRGGEIGDARALEERHECCDALQERCTKVTEDSIDAVDVCAAPALHQVEFPGLVEIWWRGL